MEEKRIYLPDIVGAGYGKYWYDRRRYRVLKGGKGSKKSATTYSESNCRNELNPADL